MWILEETYALKITNVKNWFFKIKQNENLNVYVINHNTSQAPRRAQAVCNTAPKHVFIN
jgi:hypothetical protein